MFFVAFAARRRRNDHGVGQQRLGDNGGKRDEEPRQGGEQHGGDLLGESRRARLARAGDDARIGGRGVFGFARNRFAVLLQVGLELVARCLGVELQRPQTHVVGVAAGDRVRLFGERRAEAVDVGGGELGVALQRRNRLVDLEPDFGVEPGEFAG